MQNTKAIIHDWDDTITASFDTYIDWHYDFARFNNLKEPTRDEIINVWGRPVSGIIIGLWPEISLEDTEDLITEFITDTDMSAYIPPVFDGVNETLEKLSENYVLGILTSGLTKKMNQVYELHMSKGAAKHKFIHCQEDTKHHKPDPRVFDKAMNYLTKLSILENETLYVGDSLLDYFAARDRGMHFVATTTGVTPKEKFLKEGLEEKYILEAFSDLPKVLS